LTAFLPRRASTTSEVTLSSLPIASTHPLAYARVMKMEVGGVPLANTTDFLGPWELENQGACRAGRSRLKPRRPTWPAWPPGLLRHLNVHQKRSGPKEWVDPKSKGERTRLEGATLRSAGGCGLEAHCEKIQSNLSLKSPLLAPLRRLRVVIKRTRNDKKAS
jgi:hypothetical protein